jgi:CDP-diacylglycerol pyrophosphatase
MNSSTLRRWAPIALAAMVLAACAGASAPPLPPPPTHANGLVLWRIVHDQCVPDQGSHGAPAPCALVSLAGGEAHGFVVLKDRDGVAQHLLLPTARITGIEDPALLAPDAANYFARAWDERHFVTDRLGRRLDRTQLSVAVNSAYGRSQDQLHLHIDCLAPAVGAALRGATIPRGGRWASQPVMLKGHPYRVRWLGEAALASDEPFKRVAHDIPGARRAMGAWTLALVGATGADGAPGFYLLAARADPAHGDYGSAEELQDHACEV